MNVINMLFAKNAALRSRDTQSSSRVTSHQLQKRLNMIRVFASSKQRLLKSTRTDLATTSDHISMAPGIYIKNNITVRREVSSKVRLEVSGREKAAN